MSQTLIVKNDWEWIVTGLHSGVFTFLNRLVKNVQVTFTLNQPAIFTGDVPSDDPEINITQAGEPFVSYGDKLVYGFRREGGSPPWTCRFGGVLTIIEDEAGADQPISHLTAHDPWQWLNTIPVVNADGSLLGSNGLSYTATDGNVIALDLLTNALAVVVAENPSNPLFIDQASGTIETTDPIDINFQQGMSVGEAWTQLTDTGSMDIILEPVFDPLSRPGKLVVLNIYNEAGTHRNKAIFGWDKYPRSLTGISRMDDFTQAANVAQFYAGGRAAPQQTNAPSVTKYGQYWLSRSFQPNSPLTALELLELAQVTLRRKGKRTVTIDPAPELSPEPFIDYNLGDQVPVWAGRRTIGGGFSIRDRITPGTPNTANQWSNPMRVYAIPITLGEDQVETVSNMLMSDPQDS